MNNRPENKSGRRINKGAVILSVIAIALAAANIYLYNDTLERGGKAFREAFDISQKETDRDTFDRFYAAAFEQYRTKNDILTEISSDNKGGRLNVLSISDEVFIIQENADSENDSSVWLRVPFEGSFSIDPGTCEFITDSQRNVIKARIPRPEFAEFTADYEHSSLVTFSKASPEGISANGESAARQQIQENDIRIQEYISSNKKYCENASAAAEKTVRQILLALNTYENIRIEIEFFDS